MSNDRENLATMLTNANIKFRERVYTTNVSTQTRVRVGAQHVCQFIFDVNGKLGCIEHVIDKDADL